MALADEIDRLISLLRSRVEQAIRKSAVEPGSPKSDVAGIIDSIFEDQARQISELAEQHESRGEQAMVDLLRVVRDEHLPEIRKEYGEPAPD